MNQTEATLPDTIEFSALTLYLCQFKLEHEGPDVKRAQVCVLADGVEDAMRRVRDGVIGTRFQGIAVVGVAFIQVSPVAQQAPLLP